MKISEYLKDKLAGIILILVSIGIMDCVLYVVDLGILETCIIDGLFMLTYLITLLVEYIRKNSFYKTLLKSLNNLDKKFLLSEVIESPNFLEGRILYECEKEVNKSMNDEIFRYNKQSKEYREYIETWVHEVKTPIASSKLIIENNKNEVTESLLEEIEKIEYFVEQTLFYSRSNNVEKDYIITKISLKDIVNPVIRKNSKYLIARGVKIDISNLDIEVYTDKKWIEFIVNQVLNNGIKYTYKDPVFKIYGREEKDKVILIIKDNGVGISEKDIGRIFDKGFTGNNGRESAKSTGLGLYLCRKLANKLGLAINVYSKEYVGTEVEIVFPKGELFEV